LKKIEWLARLNVLFTAVFLSSFLSLLSEYMVPTNIHIITWVLIITCIIEMIFPYHKVLRWFVEFVVMNLIMLYYIDWKNIISEIIAWSAIQNMSFEQILQMESVNLFISIVAWVFYLCMVRWFASKWRAIAIILIAAIGLSIIDTFTYHDLMNDIIMLISAGLLLLVVNHLNSLREKSPDGWEHLIEYPATVITPVALFFTVLLFFRILTPDVPALLTDPYTAWKNITGGEKEISAYIDPESLGNRADIEIISGYSRDDRQLGGAFDYDYTPVMSVETSDPTYYRGEVRYFYNGSGWEHEDKSYHFDNHMVFADVGEQFLTDLNDPAFDFSLLETKEITQTITFSEHDAYKSDVLFGSYLMESVEIVESVEKDGEIESSIDVEQIEVKGPLLWLPTVAELHYYSIHDGIFPKQYKITSQVPLVDEDGLRAAKSISLDDDWDKYLQLPIDLPSRVSELASEIVAEQANAYDQVKAIETYLKETYTYTTQPDLSLGKSEDFVDQFLFELQEGYCDYFSTAMVVLTRTLDIPARWVKGYTYGSKRIDENDLYYYYQAEQEPLGPGIYDVANANAHSWVEVYFPGYGWLPFEPTATFSAPTYKVTPETNLDVEVAMDETMNADTNKSFSIGKMVLIVLVVIVVVIIFGIVLLFLSKRKLSFSWYRWKHRGVKSPNQMIVVEVERLLTYGRRHGYQNFNYETLPETISRWSKQNRFLEKELNELVTLFERAKYGKKQMTNKELLQTQDMVRRLKKLMKIKS